MVKFKFPARCNRHEITKSDQDVKGLQRKESKTVSMILKPSHSLRDCKKEQEINLRKIL